MDTVLKHCQKSGETFEVNEKDQTFLQQRGLPQPTLGPTERRRRRLSFRNQRHLHRRQCSATGVPMISNYAPEYPGIVVTQEYWWSDAWDPLASGRAIDFTRPFFEQFKELFHSVPQPCAMVTLSENCEYNAYCAKSKNCYLSQSVAECENVYYTFGPTRSRDCIDCHNVDTCELCYEVVFGSHCYDVRMSRNVAHCQQSSFLFNCRSCSNCFFCSNLRGAEYCFDNEKLSRAAYEEKVQQFLNLSESHKQELTRQFLEFQSREFVPALWGTQNEAVSGNQINNSKNVAYGFDIVKSEDVAHVWRVHNANNSLDADYVYQGEQLYEVISILRSSRVLFGFALYDNISDVEYSASCASANNLFGCVGVRQKNHCLLNVSYTQAEYQKLRKKLIAHMRETGEWGEFFPSEISPFPYNESVGHDFYPLTREDVALRGLHWREPDPETHRATEPCSELPERSSDAGVQVCGPVYGCSTCGRGYKIQQNELALLQKLRAPLPHRCFECRYQGRLHQLEEMKLFTRACAKCGSGIEACWKPEDPQPVLCESCYLQMVN